jgi:hypothetical protein
MMLCRGDAMLDFNPDNLAAAPISVAINDAIERARPTEVNVRQYLGASSIGSPCPRQVQYDWMCDPVHGGQLQDIFARGHLFEDMVRGHMVRACFEFAPTERLAFSTLGGDFRGHADGIVTRGPELPGVGYPCVWECKALGDKGWRSLDRDGLDVAYPHYKAQVLMYQHYLGVTANPAIFTATNANTCGRLHVLVPYDAVAARAWIDRAETIIAATRAGELLPRLAMTSTNPICRKCSHTERCWR